MSHIVGKNAYKSLEERLNRYPHLIFDNRAYKSHKAMASILAVILKLPPIHKLMASRQMKSVYLAKLLENS